VLTLWGTKNRYCDGVSRRDFLQIGTFGTGLSLAGLLRGRAAAGTASSSKAAIMIYLGGGPSHIDTYDPKPDAAAEFRGEFKAIPTNVAGVRICEHLPRQARIFDKLAVVRSLVSVDEHADDLVMSGRSQAQNRQAHHPSFGSVIARVRAGATDVPPYVSLYGLTHGQEPGFLGAAYRAFTPSDQGSANLRLAQGIDLERFDDRRSLLANFDQVRRDIDASGNLRGLDAFAGRAFDMVATGAVRRALDLTREEPRTLDRYKGNEDFLRARRLIEAGAGCVTLSIGSWDTHSNNFAALRAMLPRVDQAVSCLVQDLCDRGMDRDVLTVMWGEFGRTPRINGGAGRDHWPAAMSALVAGGGLKMGQAIGATTSRGETPRDRSITVPQLLSTFYRALGIDPGQTFTNASGRPVHVIDDR
jgi:uncharacterized protein (DUF1501 family)